MMILTPLSFFMNINRALIVLFGILIVLAALIVFQLNQTKSARIEQIYTDNEALMTNVVCASDIVRSYENEIMKKY